MPGLPLLTVSFGEPQHGWLPITLQSGDFQIALDASNVPANPLELLSEALAKVSSEGSATITWNLEPAVCWFSFENQSNTVTLEITEASGHNRPSICLLRLTGSIRTILFPLHKALAEFAARKYSEKHWPTLAESRIKHLGQLLRGQR